MKKLLCMLLIFAIMLTGVFALSSCDDKKDGKDKNDKNDNQAEVAAPQGYTTFNNDDIAFAYPSNWTKTEGSITQIINPSGAGNNITVIYEAKNNIYETSSEAELKALFTQTMNAAGMRISNFKVLKIQNQNINNIIKITLSTSMNSVSMTQTLFIVNAGSKTYTVTITEVNPDSTLVSNVFNTLTVLK